MRLCHERSIDSIAMLAGTRLGIQETKLLLLLSQAHVAAWNIYTMIALPARKGKLC
jgi:hypothetical protein